MAKLRSSNIEPSTGTTLALGASGDAALISSDSIKANTWQDLGGNSLFVSDGSGTLSSVNSGLAGGGYTLISTNTADASTTVDITTGIDSTYDEYVFVCTDINPSTDHANLQVQFNASGESGFNETITSTFWQAWNLSTGGSDESINLSTGQSQGQGTAYQQLTAAMGNEAAEGCAGIFTLYSPSSTTYVKHFVATFNTFNSSLYTYNTYIAGFLHTASAITQVSWGVTAGNFDGVIQMYGVS